MGLWTRLLRRLGALGAVMVASGCSAPGALLESASEVMLWSVGAVLHNPVWSYRAHALVALTDDHRLAEITAGSRPEDAKMRLSAPMAVGRNLQISQKDDRVVFVRSCRSRSVAGSPWSNLTVCAKSMISTPARLRLTYPKTRECGYCSPCRRTECR